jgi:hypothetical protein
MFLLGMAGGVASIFGYLLFGRDVTATNIVLVAVFAPVFQGLLLMLYGFIGYPLYAYLAARHKFGLHLNSTGG